jgi:hypothetical protein
MAKKKAKKKMSTEMPMSSGSHRSVSVEKAGNGYVLRMYDSNSKQPKDIVQIAKNDEEAQEMMMKMMGMGGMKSNKMNGKNKM